MESDQVKSVYSSLQNFININANLKDLICEDDRMNESFGTDAFSNGNQISNENAGAFGSEENAYGSMADRFMGNNGFDKNLGGYGHTPIKSRLDVDLPAGIEKENFSASKIVQNSAIKSQINNHNRTNENHLDGFLLQSPNATRR